MIFHPRKGGGGGDLHMSRYGDVPLFWVLFWAFSDFWGPFWEIPGFLGIVFMVKFDFFRNNPDFWALILIFY